MLELARTVRFCLNDGDAPAPPRDNTFSAWPPMRGLGRYYQLHVRCLGEADPVTGYFLNIKEIDTAVREHVLPHLQSLTSCRDVAMGQLMREVIERLQTPLMQSVAEVKLDLTPFYQLQIEADDMDHVLIQQQYEFAAAHRLHVDALSDDENRKVFGKCNNPSGHGHNYRLQVTARAPIDPEGKVIEVADLDALVDDEVIQKLDHKHLNVDVPQFAELNPSVENITKVIWDMLEKPIETLAMTLDAVSVWETGKTVCTYRGVDQRGVKY